MLALISVWISLFTLLLAATMVLYRPAFTDISVVMILYFGSPGSLCLAGLVLWAYRKEDSTQPGIAAQRTQAQTALVLALIAAAIVYLLIIQSEKMAPIESPPMAIYNPRTDKIMLC